MSDGHSGFIDINPALMQEFLTESLESLTNIDTLFVGLEQNPGDRAAIDKIFRPVHSIKGNSSFFGLTNIKVFSHTMETLLQELRGGKREITGPVIDVLLQCVDQLRAMMESLKAGNLSVEFAPEQQEALDALQALEAGGAGRIQTLAESIEKQLSAMGGQDLPDAAQVAVEALTGEVEKLLSLVRPEAAAALPSADGNQCYRLGDDDLTEAVQTLFAFVKEVVEAEKDEERSDAFMTALKSIQKSAGAGAPAYTAAESLLDDYTSIHNSGIGFDALLQSLLQEKLEAILSHMKTAKAPVQSDTYKAAPRREEKPTAGGGGKTLRVAEEKVDDFMNYIGELIIASEVFNYIQKKLAGHNEIQSIVREFKNANHAFNELSTSLQRSLMEVRRVPVRNILQKLPRIVRDLSGQMGKQVELVLDGDTTQIDKSLVEALEDPIVHMVRNCVDHAIEMPADRVAAGKPEKGTVRIHAEATDETFSLVIADDGHGLDAQGIRAKAVERGQITEARAEQMSDADTYQLIFAAGVSTAKTVTDVSGRGVGMDVVNSNIQRVNGHIEIESTPGKGTTFTIVLPMTVTLLVVDSLVARVGTERYIIPLAAVHESIRPTADQVSTVTGRGEVLDVRGDLHRLLRLDHVLEVEADAQQPEEGTVVLVTGKRGSCGLLVDELLGQQSVVLKSLGDQFESLEMIQGGAILGDGRVGLVLDVDGLLTTAFGERQ